MIVADRAKPHVRKLDEALRLAWPDAATTDLVIVIGGDGSMLRAVRTLGTSRTYLGLNAGHVGFMLNDIEDIQDAAAKLAAGRYDTWSYPVLTATITTEAGAQTEEVAINDVYMERMTGQTARMTLAINGEPIVDPLVADGIIFATALGSTAYTYSAGGPAAHPALRTLFVTPICAHRPRLAPLALPATARAHVRVHATAERPVRVVADGRETDHVEVVEVGFSGDMVRLAYFEGHDFTRTLVRKLL